MRLFEYQAKQIFKENSIPVPNGILVSSISDLKNLPLPVVLKIQVPVGGRGKAGGIRIVKDKMEAEVVAAELFKMKVKGYSTYALLAEELIHTNKEMYLAALYNKKTNLPMIMASAAGGVEIEQIARENPSAIFHRDIDLTIGLHKWTIEFMSDQIGVVDVAGLGIIAQKILSILLNYDATLVEINPLGETPAGLVAMDSKILLDDKGAFRRSPTVEKFYNDNHLYEYSHLSKLEKLARDYEITYVPMNGEIAMISDGAGTGMLTLDLIQDFGGTVANFCEMGGLSNADTMERSIEVVISNPQVTVLLISLIGGMTRMDEMAIGIANFLNKHDVSIPIVVRMCGTQEDAGKAILHEVGIEAFRDLEKTVQCAVGISKGREACQS